MSAMSDVGQAEAYILHGGSIHPMGDDHGVHSAILVQDGRVQAIGDIDEVRTAAGRSTLEIDLEGRSVIPGLVDTHPHALHYGVKDASVVDISEAADYDEIIALIAAHARTVPPGTWIRATPIGDRRYYVKRTYRDLKERTMPDRHVLDRASAEHPIVIEATAPRTPNICSMNSMALQLLGLNDRMPERVADVWVDKDHAGRLTGIFRGSVTFDFNLDPYWGQILSKIPRAQLSHAEQLDGVRSALRSQNALGVTTIYEPHYMTVPQLELYRELHRNAELTVRVAGALQDEMRDVLRQPFTTAEYVEFLQELAVELGPGDEWLRFDSLATGWGGMIWGGTSPTIEPYSDPYGNPTKGAHFVSFEKARSFIEFCADQGIHAVLHDGGGVTDAIFEVLEQPRVVEAIRRHGWLIAHAPVVTPRTMERYAALGVKATTSVGFTWSHGDIYVERIGEHLLADATPLARWRDAGIPTAHGTDWGPGQPFMHIQLAERLELAGSGRKLTTEHHSLSRREAIAAWTSVGADVLRWPDIGSLRQGAFADLAVLDRDPFECEVDEVGTIAVTTTIVGGKVVYEA